MTTRWQNYRVRLRAEIDGKAVPVTQVGVDWELNAIPAARLLLPLGYETSSRKLSAAHGSFERSDGERSVVKIWAHLRLVSQQQDGPAPQLGIPAKEFLLFEGDVVGDGYERYNSQAMRAVYAKHWLVRMNDSSALSASSHPANPISYSFGGILAAAAAGGAGVSPHYVPATIAAQYVTADTLAEDLWGKALYPFLQWFTAQDGLYIPELELRGSGKNDGAASALARLAPPSDEDRGCYQPLTLQLPVDPDLAEGIITHSSLLTTSPEEYAAYTLWDVLVGKYAQEFFFSVVPLVDRALVVPFVPALRTPWQTIAADEHTHAQLNQPHDRALRAMGVLTNIRFRAGADDVLGSAVEPGLYGLGGWYEGRKTGMVVIRQAPGWLRAMTSEITAGYYAAGGDQRPVSTAITPGVGDARAQNAPQAAQVKSFFDQYARTMYVIEALKGRQGIISGPPRFNIAPGSTVKVLGAVDVFTDPAQDKLAVPHFGTVLRVSFLADAESGMAATSYHLAYTRTAEENEADGGVDEHPLYTAAFQGCALVESDE